MDDLRKVEVGRVLVFVGYDPAEEPGHFSPGDLVTVAERNGCGMGIDVIGPDGTVDMVWAEEVEIRP